MAGETIREMKERLARAVHLYPVAEALCRVDRGESWSSQGLAKKDHYLRMAEALPLPDCTKSDYERELEATIARLKVALGTILEMFEGDDSRLLRDWEKSAWCRAEAKAALATL